MPVNSAHHQAVDAVAPGLDGFEVVRRLREAGRFVPVMLLTARSHTDDVLAGLGYDEVKLAALRKAKVI